MQITKMSKWFQKFGRFAVLGAAVLVAGLTGCGGSGDRAPVTGKVTLDGQPVTGGTITFVPAVPSTEKKSAKPATGEVQPDGTFVLGTEGKDDGAAIAQHQVTYSPPVIPWEAPEWDGRGKPPVAPTSPYEGLIVKTASVRVEKGKNEIEIELQALPKPEVNRSAYFSRAG